MIPKALAVRLGLELAAACPPAASVYFKFLPRVFRQLHEDRMLFEQWVRTGLASAKSPREEAVAYFQSSVESASRHSMRLPAAFRSNV